MKNILLYIGTRHKINTVNFPSHLEHHHYIKKKISSKVSQNWYFFQCVLVLAIRLANKTVTNNFITVSLTHHQKLHNPL